MKKRILALIMATVMGLSLVACGAQPTATTTPDPTPTTEPTKAPTQAPVAKVDPSIDFEDGNMGFVDVYKSFATADASTLEVATFNGSKALKVTKADPKKTPIVAIDVLSLLGDNASKVASVSMSLGTEYADGKFRAASGQILFWTDKTLSKMAASNWSVYLQKKNPYVSTAKVPEGVTISEETPIVLVYFKEDLGVDNGGATLYIDDITFLDKDGKTIKPATTDVAFKGPAGFKEEKADRTNLASCSSYVTFPGFAVSGGGWAQTGLDIPQEILDAIVPGTTIEIEYTSEDGTIWLVFPNSTKGWMRVAQGEAYINGSKSVAQIDYDQIVAILGEDKTTWGPQLQCEAQTAWEVYSLKVGTIGAPTEYVKDVEFDGFAVSGGGWAQAGLEMPQEILDALVPGSVVEIAFTAEDDTLWLVFPDSAKGWMRVAQGAATIADGKAYITYEQIVEALGEDKTGWGARMQCESQTAWEVYSASVGKMQSVVETEYVKDVDFEGFTATGGGWAQAGLEMPQSILDALVPGSVVEVAFTAEDDTLWLVFPDSAKGWMRVAQGAATIADGKAYITYEQIVEALGEDKSGWGARMQCESQTAWEVFSVSVGKMVEKASTPRLHKYTAFENFAVSGGGWAQNGLDMTQAVLDALVPGSVVEVAFTAEDDTLWLVFPDSAKGWMRVAQGAAVIADGKAYITYEQIVEALGEDKTGWGARMQCESQTAWEVYSVQIGQR